MLKKNWFGASTLILALALLIALYTFALPCPVMEGEMPMRCFWSHRALKGLCVMIALVGGLALYYKEAIAIRLLALFNLLISGYGLSLVTFLIGTCQSDQMRCNLTLKPTTFVFMALNILISIFVLLKYKDGTSLSDSHNR